MNRNLLAPDDDLDAEGHDDPFLGRCMDTFLGQLMAGTVVGFYLYFTLSGLWGLLRFLGERLLHSGGHHVP